MISYIRRRWRGLKRHTHRWLDDRKLAGPRVLAQFSKDCPQAYFIEVGANDGTMMDPLHKVIARSGWSGIALEPVPDLFEKLQEHYQPLISRVTPLNLAITIKNGSLPFNWLKSHADLPPLPDWANGLGSFEREVILKHADRIPNIARYIQTIDVQCRDWASLCREQNVATLDLLMIDTEGHDLIILNQLDLNQWRPALIIFEHHHLSAEDVSQAYARLQKNNYQLFSEGLDTWCLDMKPSSQISPAMRRKLVGWISASRYASSIEPVQVPKN